MNPWPQNCGTSHCSCVQCVAPLSPHHRELLRQALEALENSQAKFPQWKGTVAKTIEALKEELE